MVKLIQMTSKKIFFLKKSLILLTFLTISIAGGAGVLSAIEPSESIRIVGFSLQFNVSAGSSARLLGEHIADSRGIATNIDVKLIKNSDYPKAIEDFKSIYRPDKNKKEPTKALALQRLQDLYQNKGMVLVYKLLAKYILIFSLGFASAYILSAVIFEKIKRSINKSLDVKPLSKKTIILSFLTGVLISILFFGLNVYHLSHDKNITKRIESVIAAPIDEYILTGTSKSAANFETINTEINKELKRVTELEKSLRKGSKELGTQESKQVSFIIASDSHNLPSTPLTLQNLLRASNADGSILLGDFLNAGAQFEIDSLSGIKIGDVTFSGYNSIFKCKSYDAKQNCTSDGGRFPLYGLTGNHDTSNFKTELEKLGIGDLTRNEVEELPNIYALDDFCHVDTKCSDDYHEANKKYAEQELEKFKEKYSGINANDKPEVGFFASEDAAKVFIGELKTIVHGGKHLYGSEVKSGTKIISVGTIGAGFPRGAKYSNAVLLTFDVKNNDANSVNPSSSLSSCQSIIWDQYLPNKAKINQCY